MPLTIFYGDRIEKLADVLERALVADKKDRDDPFDSPKIVVPNNNLAKWLQIRRFSKKDDLCAGVEFPFIEQALTKLLCRNLPDPSSVELLPNHAYAIAILGMILSHRENDGLEPFRAYVFDGKTDARDISSRKQSKMAWQLAETLAELMDEYEVRRPEIVYNWLQGRDFDGNPLSRDASVKTAEAFLARGLWGKGGYFPPDGNRLSLRQLFDRVKTEDPKPPATPSPLYVFGLSTLSQLQVDILVWLARAYDIHLFYNGVCLEYWGDSAEDGRTAPLGHGEESVLSDENMVNPLLKSWGIAGRETLRLLTDAESREGERGGSQSKASFEWICVAEKRDDPKTLLEAAQSCVRRDKLTDGKRLPQDASIQIVGTPGIRREVEMVYNSILGSVWMPPENRKLGEKRPWSDCDFSDIAVLVPDMATYRPIIESVFDARGDGDGAGKIPYSLLDGSAAGESRYLSGLLALANLARKGLTRETLFDVLENPCVQIALGFTREDVSEWRTLTQKLGAFDEFEGDPGKTRFNWAWALQRLRFARVANSLSTVSGDSPAPAMPLMADGDSSALRFSSVVELLFRGIQDAFYEADGKRRRLPCTQRFLGVEASRPTHWAWQIGQFANDFLAVPPNDRVEESVRKEVLHTLHALGAIEGKQDVEVVWSAIEQFAGGLPSRRGGCLTHGVTIAGLRPMRPVPFKQVYILGMGENGFPGRTGESALDLRGSRPRLGDTSIPNVNRYLFLETLMATRERLVLSYPNRDIEKDSEMFPSSLIHELKDFLSAGVLKETFDGTGKRLGFREFGKYPLLEHGEGRQARNVKSAVCAISWSPTDPDAGILPTYSATARAVARRRGSASARVPSPSVSSLDSSPLGLEEITAQQLAEFIRNPMKAVLRHRLHIQSEQHVSPELSSDSPLGVDGSSRKRQLENDWIRDGNDFEKAFLDLQLSGSAPVGFLGDFAKGSLLGKLEKGESRIRDFIQTFERTEEVFQKSFVSPIGSTVVRYSVSMPDWSEADGVVSVFTTGPVGKLPSNGTVKPAHRIPPSRALDAWVSFLLVQASPGNGTVRSLRVGIVDPEAQSSEQRDWTGVWEWASVTPEDARAYVKCLTEDYLDFLKGLLDVGFDRMAKALSDDPSFDDPAGVDWPRVLQKYLSEDSMPARKGKKSSSDVFVIERTAREMRRTPTADDLRILFEKRFAFPMSAVRAG